MAADYATLDVLPLWIPSSTDGFDLELSLEPGASYVVAFEARLGPLAYSWSTAKLEVPFGETARLVVEVPPEAFLDLLAADYLTDLYTKVTVTDPGGGEHHVPVPPAYLAWPEGAAGAAVVWDHATAFLVAPLGVVSDTVRAQYDGIDSDRVGVPIFGQRAPLEETDLDDAGGEG